MTNELINMTTGMDTVETMIAEEYDLSAYAATEAAIEAAGSCDTKESDSRWLAAMVITAALCGIALKLEFLYASGLLQRLLQLIG